MEQLNPRSRRDKFGTKINRTHWRVLVYGIPWLTVLFGSLTPLLPIIAPVPLLPPMGFLLLLSWRLLRPGLFPLWAGFPLGLFDDLFSGQPLGSAIVLYSATLISLDLLEHRFPWRGFLQDWMMASICLALYLSLALLMSGAEVDLVQIGLIVPQLLFCILIYPLIVRLAVILDGVRLWRILRIR